MFRTTFHRNTSFQSFIVPYFLISKFHNICYETNGHVDINKKKYIIEAERALKFIKNNKENKFVCREDPEIISKILYDMMNPNARIAFYRYIPSELRNSRFTEDYIFSCRDP